MMTAIAKVKTPPANSISLAARWGQPSRARPTWRQAQKASAKAKTEKAITLRTRAAPAGNAAWPMAAQASAAASTQGLGRTRCFKIGHGRDRARDVGALTFGRRAFLGGGLSATVW